MKRFYAYFASFAFAALPMIAQAHPGHPESDHLVGGLVVLAAGVYAIKRGAGLVARAVRVRKR